MILPADVPNPMAPPPGCAFHTRCSLAVERCRVETPLARDLGDDHSAACHLVEPGAAPPDIRRAA